MTNAKIVEQNIPLSQSFIWDLQCQFYESLGVDAWLSGVIPSSITTNSSIALTYARMIAAYAADIEAEELTIVELGAGHGRFGFLCIQHLIELENAGLLRTKWKFVMTDVAERNIVYWQQHAALRPLVERGVLDFARFKGGADSEIRLRESGETISANHQVQNLVIIGNYFFDSLPIDVWQANQGKLFECHPVLSLKPGATCSDKQDADILNQLEVAWDLKPVTGALYEHAEWNTIVDALRDRVGSGAFTLPVGSLQTLDLLDRWSKAGYLLLTADKGYLREEDLVGRPLPTMVHHGCFSFSLNFCAIAKWIENQGGRAWLPDARHGDLEFVAFSKTSSQKPLLALDRAYQTGPAAFSPGDYHQVVRRCGQSNPDLRTCLSLIRLSGHDPQILYTLRRAVRAQVQGAPQFERQAVRNMLEQVAARYFHLYTQDVPFAIGLIYQYLGDHADALRYYEQSLQLFGENVATFCNMAACLMELGDVDFAKVLVHKAAQLDGEDSEVLALAERLELPNLAESLSNLHASIV